MDNGIVDILVPIFVALFTAIGIVYQQNKRQRRDNDTERAVLSARTDELEACINGQAAIIESHKADIERLAARAHLYDTLKEAHDLLKQDYGQLKATVDMQGEKIAKLSVALDEAREMETTLRAQISALTDKCHKQETTIEAYRDALELVGATMKSHDTTENEEIDV